MRISAGVAALLLLGGTALGCAARGATCARPDACGARAVPGPCAEPVARREPVHPRRDGCLAGEWAPRVEDAPEVAGLTHSLGRSEREHVLVRAGSRVWTDEEIQAYRAAHERDLFALGFVQSAGSGAYCEQPVGTTLAIEIGVCAVPLAEIAAWLRDRLAGTVPDDVEARFCISLGGATGPRCEPDDPRCGPVPYTGELERIGYSCDRERYSIQGTIDRGLSRGECAHDGECVEAGCGNHCVAWPEGGFAATCEAYSDLEAYPALCGCVAGRCAWFRL